MKNNKEYEFKPVSDFKATMKDFDIPFNVKANKEISYSFDFSIASNNSTNQSTDEGKTNPEPKSNPIEIKNITNISIYNINEYYKIQQIDQLPLSFIIKLSKTKGKFNESHFEDLLFNFNFNFNIAKKEMNNSKTSLFDEFQIKSKLVSSQLNLSDINNKLSEILYSSKTINGTFDLSTKSVILHFEKNYLQEEWNKTENKDSESTPSLIFYINRVKSNKTNIIDEKSLSGEFFLIYKNCSSNDTSKDNKIKQKTYINDRIQIGSKKNIYLYRLSSNEEDNLFVVDFSSNYALSRGVYLTFFEFSKINSFKENEENTNSSNIVFHKNTGSFGKVYHFEFELKDKNKDVVLCVISKIKKSKKEKPLSNLNYIFKYYTTKTSEQEKLYKGKIINFSQKVGQASVDKKTELSISSIAKENSTIPKFELYVRKVIKDNRLIREEFDSIGIIESKYELINGDVQLGKNGITIKLPEEVNKDDFYSIFINIPELNEKLVYDTINTQKPQNQLWLLILIFSGIPVLLGLIIAIIIIAHNKSVDNLREKIMTTSFKESGTLGNREDEEEEKKILE